MISITSYDDVKQVNLTKTLFGREIFSTNAYIIGDLLIDTGFSNMSKEFLKVLKPFNIKTVVNTHAHPDHIGSNYAFPFTFIHQKGFNRLKNPKFEIPIQKYIFGTPKASKPKKVPEKIINGYIFNVLYTPGHSPDHISLYEPNRKWAFTGDLLLWGPTREVFTDVKIHDAIESLRRLSRLEIAILFPGHGSPFMNPNDDLRKQIEFLEILKKQIRKLQESRLKPKEIRNEIFGKERLFTYLTGGKFSSLNLVNSYLEKSDSISD